MRKSYPFLLVFLCLNLTSLAQNSSLNLTGSNYVTAGVDVINPSGDFTVEFWAFIPNPNDHAIHTFISQGTTGLSFSVGIAADGTIQVGDPAAWPSTGIPMPFDQWTHMAVSFNSSSGNAILYVNGKNTAIVPGFIFTDLEPFRIGVQTDLSQPTVGNIDEVKAWNVIRTPAQIKGDIFGAPLSSDATLVAWYTMNNGSGLTVTNNATSTGTSQNGFITGDDPVGANSWAASPVQFGNNGLVFDGGTSQVNILPLADNSYDLSSASGGTVEFWVNPTTLNPSPSYTTILGNRGAGGVRYSFHLSSDKIGLDNGTAINTLDYAVPAGTATWTHLAFVTDGATTTAVYVNGIFQGNITGTLGTGVGQPLTLGINKNITGPDDKPFAGGIDEVRIWNYQRTASDILANRDFTLTGNESGLIGQFSFDMGVSNGNNAGLKTALDNSVNSNNGALANFLLSGTTSNLTSHGLLNPLPVTLTVFTATRSGNEAVLQWQTATEENTRNFVIERSTDGKTYTDIGTVDAAGNSKTLLNYSYTDPQPEKNNNFYRLKQVDLDGNFTYSPVRVVNFPSTSKLIWYATGKGSAEVLLQQGGNEPYAVFDAAGHLLRMGQLSNGRTQLSQLPPGIYFVRVSTTAITVLLP